MLGTLLANRFLHYLPDVDDYFGTRHFKKETEELALLIKKYSKGHTSYSGLNVATFATEDLPDGIYKNVDDIDFESIKGNRVHISGSSSSRYEANQNAFIIGWMDVNRAGCKAMVKQNWQNLEDIRFLGLTVANRSENLKENEIYQNCPGAKYPNSAVICSGGKTLATPLKEDEAEAICECPHEHCVVMLKYM